MKKEYVYIVILASCLAMVVYGIIGLIKINRNINEEEIAKFESIQEIYTNSENTVSTISQEKKVLPTTRFALKKFYDECSHFEYEEAELPIELVNLTKQEIEDYYDDWEVENFSEKELVLCKEINGYCNEHFLIKLDDEKVVIYRLSTQGKYDKYKETDIVKEYLTDKDIEKLKEGITVYGEGKLSSVLEDFE